MTLALLSDLLKKVAGDMENSLKGVKDEMVGLTNKLSMVERNVDEKIDGLCQSLESQMQNLKSDMKNEVRTQITDE